MTDPIVIAGAGPTGLTAALELSRMGIPLRIVDKAQGPQQTSRAIGVHARTLELLAQRGLAERLIARGVKIAGGDIYGEGERLVRLDFTRLPSSFPFILFVPQTETEAVLREGLSAQGIEVEWGTELAAFRQDRHDGHATGAEAVLRRHDMLEAQPTPWVIAADGAHSALRNTLGMQFEGETLPEHYALADLHIDTELDQNDLHMFASPKGLMGLFPMGDGRARLILSNPPEVDHAAPSLEMMQQAWDARAHVAATLSDLHWSSWFRINSRIVGALRSGRVIFGGDAAHIHSPAGAQGMNTGIQDMINLGWKLARVVRGTSPESLIDSYSDDRRPVMEAVLSRSEKLTEAIGAEGGLMRGVFTHLAPWLGQLDLVQRRAISQMSQIGFDYRESPLSVDHNGTGSLRAGDRMPDLAICQLQGKDWFDGRLHPLLSIDDFTVVVVHPYASAPKRERLPDDIPFDKVVEIAPSRNAPRETDFDSLFGRHGRCLLVRPDGYVGLTCPIKTAGTNLADYARNTLGQS